MNMKAFAVTCWFMCIKPSGMFSLPVVLVSSKANCLNFLLYFCLFFPSSFKTCVAFGCCAGFAGFEGGDGT